MNRLTRKEKDEQLKSILGLEDEPASDTNQDLEFSDNLAREPEESFYDEVKEYGDDGTIEEEPAKPVVDDTPDWAKVLQQKVEDSNQKNRALEAELRTMRQYQQQESQQQRYEQPRYQQQQQQQPADDEPYWVDSRELRQVEERIAHAERLNHQVLLRQEYESMNAALRALDAEFSKDPSMPKLNEVVAEDNIKRTFQAFAQNPAAMGGYGQNWHQVIQTAYKINSQPIISQRLKEQQAKADEMAKKREEKQVAKTQNLTKVARSGAAVQEPRESYKPGVRTYRHKSTREAALRIINGQ